MANQSRYVALMTLSSDLAAIRARLHRPTFHIPADRSFDGESIRCDYCVLHGTVARLLARLEEMQQVLSGCRSTFGHDHWDSTMERGVGCVRCIEQRKVSQAIDTVNRPLDAP